MSEQETKKAQMGGKDMFSIVVNLVAIYLAGGLIIAGVYAWASPIIFKNNKEMREKALKAMMPEAETITPIGAWWPHKKHAEYLEAKSGGETVGYVVETLGKGYSSFISTLIALNKDLVVQKIDILHHAETPGLGDEVENPKWKGQFSGKTLGQLKLVKQEGTEYIQAVSGATISSRAVTDDNGGGGVRPAVEMLKEALAGHPPEKPEGAKGGGGH